MSTLNRASGWRPRTPFHYGWLILATGILANFSGVGFTSIVLGGIQTIISADTGWSSNHIALATTAGSWSFALSTPILGALADRYGPRVLMPLAALVAGVSYLAISSADALWQFYMAIIIGRSLGEVALMGIVPRTAVVNFFNRRRNLALGLMSVAFPIGAAITIQIFSLLSDSVGWRIIYRFYLGMFAFAMVLPLFLTMRRKPEDIGLLPEGEATLSANIDIAYSQTSPSIPSTIPIRETNWSTKEVVKTSTFWLLVITSGLGSMIFGAVVFQIVPYLEASGLSRGVSSVALSLAVVVASVLSPGWGYLADRIHPRHLALFAAPMAGIAMSLVLVSGGGALGFAMLIIWAAFFGGMLFVLNTAVLVQYFGRTSFGSISGLMTFFTMVSLGLGPTLSSLIVATGSGYNILFVIVTVTHYVALFLYYKARQPYHAAA